MAYNFTHDPMSLDASHFLGSHPIERNSLERKIDVIGAPPGENGVAKATKPLYEGKNIHYSAVDGKPLCSYSEKLCKQRRLNGYAFCIRHVLEDPNAKFKRCQYVARYNHQRCSNPIPENEDRLYCNSHLQVLGLLPKTIRKRKNAPPPTFQDDPTPGPVTVPTATESPPARKQPKKPKSDSKGKATKKQLAPPSSIKPEAPSLSPLPQHPSQSKPFTSFASRSPPPPPPPPPPSIVPPEIKKVVDLKSSLMLSRVREEPLRDDDTQNTHIEDKDDWLYEETNPRANTDTSSYSNRVASRLAHYESSLRNTRSKLRVLRRKDAVSTKLVRKTLDVLKEAPVSVAAVCVQSAARPKMRRRVRPVLCTVPIGKTVLCGSEAIPFTRFCKKHISFCRDQLLFRQCAYVHANRSCPYPVYDVTQPVPFCKVHKKMYNDGTMDFQPTTKAKQKGARATKRGGGSNVNRRGKGRGRGATPIIKEETKKKKSATGSTTKRGGGTSSSSSTKRSVRAKVATVPTPKVHVTKPTAPTPRDARLPNQTSTSSSSSSMTSSSSEDDDEDKNSSDEHLTLPSTNQGIPAYERERMEILAKKNRSTMDTPPPLQPPVSPWLGSSSSFHRTLPLPPPTHPGPYRDDFFVTSPRSTAMSSSSFSSQFPFDEHPFETPDYGEASFGRSLLTPAAFSSHLHPHGMYRGGGGGSVGGGGVQGNADPMQLMHASTPFFDQTSPTGH